MILSEAFFFCWIQGNYTAKWGVQIVGMIFQTRSNTTKSEAGIFCPNSVAVATAMSRFFALK